ncbi:hypothetical protein ACWCXB_08325 [Streptomyces sp. NPDC001514]
MRHLTSRRYARARNRHATLRDGGASLTATAAVGMPDGAPTAETYVSDARSAMSAVSVTTDRATDTAQVPAAARRPETSGRGPLDDVVRRRRPTGGPRTGTPAWREGS